MLSWAAAVTLATGAFLVEGSAAAGLTLTAEYDPSHPHNRRILQAMGHDQANDLVRGRGLHVRMVGNGNKFGATALPIRNAAAPGASGRPSVNGACGGTNAYSAANAPDVPVGSKVSLSLQYAAGHESPANEFTATFACGAPGQNALTANAQNTLTAAACTTTTPAGDPYPTPAPTGRDAKVVECTLPAKTAAELAGNGGQCTVSLQDQRNWGGCVDINYVAAAADGGGGGGGTPGSGGTPGGGGTPGSGANAGIPGGGNNAAAPQPIGPVQPTQPLVITKIEKVVTSATPNPALNMYECCALSQGTLTVTPGRTSSGVSTITVTGRVTGECDPNIGFEELTLAMTNQRLDAGAGSTQFVSSEASPPSIIQSPAPQGSNNGGRVTVELGFAGVEKDAALSLTVLEGASDNPTICDAVFTFRDEDIGSIPGQNAVGPGGSLSGAAIAVLIIAILAVLGGIGFFMMRNEQGGGSGGGTGISKAPVAVAMTTKSPAPPVSTGQLKLNWKEAKDAAGDTYYFNSATGETTWERHLVTV